MKSFAMVFGAVFLAELGDKTQLATVLFALKESLSRMTVFFAASLALLSATAIAVLAGATITQLIEPRN